MGKKIHIDRIKPKGKNLGKRAEQMVDLRNKGHLK